MNNKRKGRFIIVCKDAREKFNILSEAFSKGIMVRFTIFTEEEYIKERQKLAA